MNEMKYGMRGDLWKEAKRDTAGTGLAIGLANLTEVRRPIQTSSPSNDRARCGVRESEKPTVGENLNAAHEGRAYHGRAVFAHFVEFCIILRKPSWVYEVIGNRI